MKSINSNFLCPECGSNSIKGIYKIKLLSKNEAEPLEDYTEYTNDLLQKASYTLLESVFSALESSSEIDDNRALYY